MKLYTGLNCRNGKLHKGDKVSFCGQQGTIVFECGAYGIATEECIDYLKLQSFMDENEVECCGNEFHGCENDNFISLWEIYWNFNCMENYLWMVNIVS